jgi:hypothetical protein
MRRLVRGNDNRRAQSSYHHPAGMAMNTFCNGKKGAIHSLHHYAPSVRDASVPLAPPRVLGYDAAYGRATRSYRPT